MPVFLGFCVENADFIRLFRGFDALESDGKDRFVPVQAIKFQMAWKTQNRTGNHMGSSPISGTQKRDREFRSLFLYVYF